MYLNSHETKVLNNGYSGIHSYCHSYSESVVNQLEHVPASSGTTSHSSWLGSGLGGMYLRNGASETFPGPAQTPEITH